MCVVEVANPAGSTRLEPACSYRAQEGMAVRTNTRELRDARRTIIELILANHPRACQTCIRNERCSLQSLCREYSIDRIRYEGEKRHQRPTPRRWPSLATLTTASCAASA